MCDFVKFDQEDSAAPICPTIHHKFCYDAYVREREKEEEGKKGRREEGGKREGRGREEGSQPGQTR
jgi:hypothetical protein